VNLRRDHTEAIYIKLISRRLTYKGDARPKISD
jgi:hypothetical protein